MRLTTREFIRRSRAKQARRYGYELVEYVRNNTPVIIVCKIHGPFEQIPSDHMNGRGCIRCGQLFRRGRRDTDAFIRATKVAHGQRFDYTRVRYVNDHTKVAIVCKIHGPFKQTPNDHLQGAGCRKCRDEATGDRSRFTRHEFIRKSRTVHDRDYDYDLVKYVNANTRVVIVCKIHGPFKQTPASHMDGHGCNLCWRKNTKSRGVTIIEQYLEKFHIAFIREVRLIPGSLKAFDFYLPDRATIIEFHGQQHFHSVEMWGGNEGFKVQRKNDRIKKTWATRNGYKPIVIPYTCKDIAGFLTKALAGQVHPDSAMRKHRDSSKENRERERRLRNSKLHRLARERGVTVRSLRAGRILVQQLAR